VAFRRAYKEFKVGREIFKAAMQRPLIGGYSMPELALAGCSSAR